MILCLRGGSASPSGASTRSMRTTSCRGVSGGLASSTRMAHSVTVSHASQKRAAQLRTLAVAVLALHLQHANMVLAVHRRMVAVERVRRPRNLERRRRVGGDQAAEF